MSAFEVAGDASPGACLLQSTLVRCPAKMRPRPVLAALLLLLVSHFVSAQPGPADFADLTPLAEKTALRLQTGRYDEVVALCRAFARRYPRQVRCAEFGRSPEGRPLLALVASADGKLDPLAAPPRGPPDDLRGGWHPRRRD